MKNPIRKWLVVATLSIAGCTVQPTLPTYETTELEARAAAAREAGDRAAAAALYLELADATRGPVRARYLIESARLGIEARDLLGARQRLADAASDATRGQLQMIQSLVALIELAEGRPAEALARIEALDSALDDETLLVALGVRGRALFALDRPVEAVRALVERELWLNDAEEILANQNQIWEGLRASRPIAPAPSGDATVDGWLALAPIAALADESARRRGLLEWRIRFPAHPAAGVLLADLLMQDQTLGYPARIALLLPLSSTNREAALAIQDGFLAAHLASGNDARSIIRLYDTSSEGASSAYLRAQLEGADFIVGPLRREEVDAVLPQAGFVTTLALNFAQSEGPFPDALYQFALAPEDEARAIAERAAATGARRAVIMMQSDAFGTRIAGSFQQAFEALGGQVLASMPYEAALQDFSSRISSLINLDRSYQRHRRLAANLGMDVAFEPRRRQDIDMIFLSADADTGRLLAPQLEYYYAGDIPTYAISEIYDPSLRGGSRDLDGIIFPDVPWLVAPDDRTLEVKAEILAHWPRRGVDVARFYGMGVDAYRLVDEIYRGGFFMPVAGASGLLRMDDRRRIHRDLPFAQFRNGLPEALPPVTEAANRLAEVTAGE